MFDSVTISPEVTGLYFSCFLVEVKYMMGDADSYVTEKIEMNEEQVLAFKNLFERGKRGDSYDQGYENDPLYREFVMATKRARGDLSEYEEGDEDWVLDYFPCDPDGWGAGSFSELSVLWYDSQGLPHAVTFGRSK